MLIKLTGVTQLRQIFLVTLFVSLYACANTLEIDIIDGSSHRYLVGQKVNFRVSLISGTGYQWHSKNNVALSISKATCNFSMKNSLAGENIFTCFSVIGLISGKYELKFELIRPWEKQPIKTLTTTLILNNPQF